VAARGRQWRGLVRGASRRLAAQLGAGRVLLGSAIATPTELTLTGSLLRVTDGTELANGSVSGMSDSGRAGQPPGARLSARRQGSARAVRRSGPTSLGRCRNLAARKAYRSGDYFAALDLYGRAFTLDSNFAQAAYGLVTTNPLVGTVFNTSGFRAIPALWRLRDRLSPRDLALLRGMTFIGPNYPHPSTYAEILAQASRGGRCTRQPEHWFVLGAGARHYGASPGPRLALRGRCAGPCHRARPLHAGLRHCTAVLVRDREAIQAGEPARFRANAAPASICAWAAAVAMGDSAGTPLANQMEGRRCSPLSAQDALPLADARWANARARREGTTAQERGAAEVGEFAVALAEGRVIDLGRGFSGGSSAWNFAGVVRQAVVEPQYRPQAQAMLPLADTDQWLPVRECFAEVLRVTTGDTSGTRRAIQRLRAFAALDPPPIPPEQWEPLEFRVCPLLLETMLEGGRDRSGASRLDALDSLMGGPRWLTLGPPTAPVVEATGPSPAAGGGTFRGALAARGKQLVSCLPDPAGVLRQEGRLAAGRRHCGARWAVRYLTLRTDPDPSSSQRDSVGGRGTRTVVNHAPERHRA
jgi:hypothetical protein